MDNEEGNLKWKGGIMKLLGLNDKEKQAIVQIIKEHFTECLKFYQEDKYPEEPYIEWKRIFPVPKNVKAEDIKNKPWNGNMVTGVSVIMSVLIKSLFQKFNKAGMNSLS